LTTLDWSGFMPWSNPNIITNTDGEKMIHFRCTSCNHEEYFPQHVVDFFDEFDDGDPDYPPRFDCLNCDSGLMQPIYYKTLNGIIYKI